MAIAAVAAAAAIMAPSVASADSSVPDNIQPPAGSVQLAKYRVKMGYQIYRCASGAWSLKAPAAMLRQGQSDTPAIYHYAGPTWQSLTDGSLVTAAKKAESPVAGSIPQLLLEVTSHGGTVGGELSTVSYIQRLNTSGGVAPAGTCTDGAEQPVPYVADYVFWAGPAAA
jgi:hypothetical protein